MTTFEMEKIPCRLDDDKKAKKRAKSESDDGPVTHKIKIVCDIYKAARMKQARGLAPGIEALAKEIAAAEDAGADLRPKKTIGCVAVELFDTEGKSWFKDATAKGGRITIKIGSSAKDTTMEIPLEVSVPRDQEVDFRDYYKADAMISIANAQLEAPLIDAPKKGKRAKKAKQTVQLAAIGDDADMPF